jgi:hypothetical protein
MFSFLAVEGCLQLWCSHAKASRAELPKATITLTDCLACRWVDGMRSPKIHVKSHQE